MYAKSYWWGMRRNRDGSGGAFPKNGCGGPRDRAWRRQRRTAGACRELLRMSGAGPTETTAIAASSPFQSETLSEHGQTSPCFLYGRALSGVFTVWLP